MGASDFYTGAQGKTASEAFQNAREEAGWEYGHGGYTGTIAEKYEFVIIPLPELPEGKTPMDYATELVNADDERIQDKWGPAGCFELGNDSYLFFGTASS